MLLTRFLEARPLGTQCKPLRGRGDTHPSAFLPGLHLRRAGGGQRPGHLAGEEEKGKFVRAGGPSPWPGVTSWASTAPCWASVVSQAGRKHRAGVGGDAFSPFSPGPIPPWVKSFPALG